MSQFHFQQLTPDRMLDALAGVGLYPDTGLLPLNSYENRVYQFRNETGERLVVKFYRPERWTAEQIRQEHALAAFLADEEVPVAVPLPLDGDTLHRHGDYWFALWPSLGGRHLEPDNLDQLEAVGHQLGRWHAAASRFSLNARPRLDPRQSLPLALAQLAEAAPWPAGLADRLWLQLTRLVQQVGECWHEEWAPLALHGDCHLGNILWRDGPLFVDLDDCLEGPAVQDLWLLLSGDQAEQRLQLDTLLAGYEAFAEFDHRQLALIEPLRTQRQIQHLAWLARRWADPAFPAAFPWFATEDFWLQQLHQLAEQERALTAPPISLTFGL